MPSPTLSCLPRLLRQLGAAAVVAWLCNAALAQTAPAAPASIYTCIDEQGRRQTADRPIAACASREQQVLNKDGSLRMTLPPTMSDEERAGREARDREAALVKAMQADAVRRDRNLMARFPNEAAHGKARAAALDTVRVAMKATEIRLRELAAERKPLQDEAEFYKGKALPPKLKQQLDANDAALAAQRDAQTQQKDEIARIAKRYDAELAYLKRLWTGAAPGSVLGMADTEPAKATKPNKPTATNSR